MDINAPDFKNEFVRLEPLNAAYYTELEQSGGMDYVWQMLPAIPKSTGYKAYYNYMVRRNQDSCIYPFAVLDRQNEDRFIGVSAFIKPHRTHRRVRLGYSWIRPDVRGGHHYAALQHAMIKRALDWGARRLEAYVESHNQTVIEAILSLGAQKEGVLRHYQKSAEGSWVDMTILSFVLEEAELALQRLDVQMRTLTSA